jgi:hypothetical protein
VILAFPGSFETKLYGNVGGSFFGGGLSDDHARMTMHIFVDNNDIKIFEQKKSEEKNERPRRR